MDPRVTKTFCDVLLLGAVFVAAGSMAGLWLPVGAALLLLAVVVCRICWIEDNIHHDLLPAKRMPPGYRARRPRPDAPGAWPRLSADEADSPRRLAAEMRLQAHAWGAFAWGTMAGVVLQAAVPLTVAAGAAALILALRQADYMALGTATLAAGRPLPERLIAGRGPLSHFAVIRRGPD